MAAFAEAYETLMQRLACRSNPVLTVAKIPRAVSDTKTHRPIRSLDPHVQLELDLKGEFQALAGDGFKMFIALVVALEFARNSVVAENLCKLLKGKAGSLSCGNFAELYAEALLGPECGVPAQYLLKLVSSTNNIDARALNIGKLSGVFFSIAS